MREAGRLPTLLTLLWLAPGCSGGSTGPPAKDGATPEAGPTDESPPAEQRYHADVVSVSASGSPQSYDFLVGVLSPETGCDRYADWWEVLSEDGALLYRRILAHSHPDEQPFERAGGPVPVDAETIVWVRAHLAPGGYGGAAMRGSVAGGFSTATLDASFAAALESSAPQPEPCAF